MSTAAESHCPLCRAPRSATSSVDERPCPSCRSSFPALLGCEVNGRAELKWEHVAAHAPRQGLQSSLVGEKEKPTLAEKGSPFRISAFWRPEERLITVYRDRPYPRNLFAYARDQKSRREWFLTLIAPSQSRAFVLRTPMRDDHVIELRDGAALVARLSLCSGMTSAAAAATSQPWCFERLLVDTEKGEGDPVLCVSHQSNVIDSSNVGDTVFYAFEPGLPGCWRTADDFGPVEDNRSGATVEPPSLEFRFRRDEEDRPLALIHGSALDYITLWHFVHRDRRWTGVPISTLAAQSGSLSVALCFNDALYVQTRPGLPAVSAGIRDDAGYHRLAYDRAVYNTDCALVARPLPEVRLPVTETSDVFGLDLAGLDSTTRTRLAGYAQRMRLLRSFATVKGSLLVCTPLMVDCPIDLLYVFLTLARQSSDLAGSDLMARFLAYPQLLQAATGFPILASLLPPQGTPIRTSRLRGWLPADLGAGLITSEIRCLFSKVAVGERARRLELLAGGMTAEQIRRCRIHYKVELTAADAALVMPLLEWLDQPEWTLMPGRFQVGSVARARADLDEQRRMNALRNPIDVRGLERLRDRQLDVLRELIVALEDVDCHELGGGWEPIAEQLANVVTRLGKGELVALADLDAWEAALEAELTDRGLGVAAALPDHGSALRLGALTEALVRCQAQEIALLMRRAAGWLRALLEDRVLVDWERAEEHAPADVAAWLQGLVGCWPADTPDVLPRSSWLLDAESLRIGLQRLEALPDALGQASPAARYIRRFAVSLRQHLDACAQAIALERLRGRPAQLAYWLNQRASELSGHFRSQADAILCHLAKPVQLSQVLADFGKVLQDDRLARAQWTKLMKDVSPTLLGRLALDDDLDPDSWAETTSDLVSAATEEATSQRQSLTSELEVWRDLASAAGEDELARQLADGLEPARGMQPILCEDGDFALLPPPWKDHADRLRELALAERVREDLMTKRELAVAAFVSRTPAMIDEFCGAADAVGRIQLKQLLDDLRAAGDWGRLLEHLGEARRTSYLKRLLAPYLDDPWVTEMLPLLAHLCPPDNPFWRAQLRVLAKWRAAADGPVDGTLSESDRASLGGADEYPARFRYHRDKLEGEWQKRLWQIADAAGLADGLPDVQDLRAVRAWWRQVVGPSTNVLPSSLLEWRNRLVQHGLLPRSQDC